jgi:hypothetical protein
MQGDETLDRARGSPRRLFRLLCDVIDRERFAVTESYLGFVERQQHERDPGRAL